MRKLAILILCCAVFWGYRVTAEEAKMPTNTCAWDSYRSAHIYCDYEIEITSEPSGARIIWNGNDIGTTPMRQMINGKQDLFANVIKAEPSGKGQYLQVKVISGYDQIPRKIHFDMRAKPEK